MAVGLGRKWVATIRWGVAVGGRCWMTVRSRLSRCWVAVGWGRTVGSRCWVAVWLGRPVGNRLSGHRVAVRRRDTVWGHFNRCGVTVGRGRAIGGRLSRCWVAVGRGRRTVGCRLDRTWVVVERRQIVGHCRYLGPAVRQGTYIGQVSRLDRTV